MRRHKPRRWSAPSSFTAEDTAEAERICTPEHLDALASLAGIDGADTRRMALLKRHIFNLSVLVIYGRRLSSRPSAAERGAAIDRLAAATKALVKCIDELDDDTRAEIASGALRRRGWSFEDMHDPAHAGTGELRRARDAAGELHALLVIPATREQLFGRKADVKRRLAEKLVELWGRLGNGRPSLTVADGSAGGRFFAFTSAVAEQLGLSGMERPVREAVGLRARRPQRANGPSRGASAP